MEDPRALRLFQEILEKTRAGRLRWEITADGSSYLAALPGGLTVSTFAFSERDRWGNSEDNFELILRGDEGDLLTVTSTVDGVTSDDLAMLYELAKRQALGVDAKVDKLLGELAKL